MGKILALLLSFMILFSFPVLGDEAPALSWDRDAQQHWQSGENGEKLNAAPHDLVDEIVCAVCGADIWTYDDGSADVYNYTPQGDLLRYTSYDASGNMVDDYRYQVEYDEEDNKVRSQCYYGDMLVEDIQYTMGPDGYPTPVKQLGYGEDGSWSVNDYDSWGNMVFAASYDADDTILYEETLEYDYDELGNALEVRIKGKFTEGDGYESVTNQYGDTTLYRILNADGSVSLEFTTQYEYDDDGNMLSRTEYQDGVMVAQGLYEIYESDFGPMPYEKTYTEYLEDGSRYVYEYDHEGEEVSFLCYDAQGQLVPEEEME